MAGDPQTGRKPRPRAGRPSAAEAQGKQQALIEAALEEFAARGYRGASLRTIAAKADISTRTLYNRYPDKTALFAACLEASSAQLRAMPQAAAPAEPPPHDLAARLTVHIVATLHQLTLERNRRIAALLYREGPEFAEVRAIARNQFERFQVDPVAQILREHGLSGDFARDAATQLVAMAFGEWQRRLLFGGEPMSAADIAQQTAIVVRIFLGGIGPDLPQ